MRRWKKQNSIGKTLCGSYHKITDCKYLSQVWLFSCVSLLCFVAGHNGPHERTARVIKCDGVTRHRWMWVIKTGLLNEHNYFLLRLCPRSLPLCDRILRWQDVLFFHFNVEAIIKPQIKIQPCICRMFDMPSKRRDEAIRDGRFQHPSFEESGFFCVDCETQQLPVRCFTLSNFAHKRSWLWLWAFVDEQTLITPDSAALQQQAWRTRPRPRRTFQSSGLRVQYLQCLLNYFTLLELFLFLWHYNQHIQCISLGLQAIDSFQSD